MKRLFSFLLCLFVINLYSQEEILNNKGQIVILNSDRTWSIKGEALLNPCLTCESFTALNGRDEPVVVKLVNGNILDNDISNENLVKAIRESLTKAKYSLKNRISFIPQQVALAKTDEGMSLIIWMIGTNSYGAEGEETVFFRFDKGGNVTGKF